jgi:hypothetical protein
MLLLEIIIYWAFLEGPVNLPYRHSSAPEEKNLWDRCLLPGILVKKFLTGGAYEGFAGF